MWVLCGLPVFVPVIGVHDCTQADHAVESADLPAGSVGLESASDHVLASAFDLAAANRFSVIESLGVVQVVLVGS